MRLEPIPLFGLGNYSRSRPVNDQSYVNMYREVEQDAQRGSRITMYPTPGLLVQSDYGESPVRGAWSHGDFKYYVSRNVLFKEANDGTRVQVGELLTGDGLVDISENGPQLMIVDGEYGYIYLFDAQAQGISTITNVGTTATLTTAAPHGLGNGVQVTITGATPALYNGTYTITATSPTTFTYVMAGNPGGPATVMGSYTVSNAFAQITAEGFPANPTGVTFLNLRFIVTSQGTGQYQWSGINDGFSWDALDFATEESNPDNLIRPVADNGQAVLFGEFTTGFAGATGDADAAFSRIGASAIEFGLAARWSLDKFDNSLIFLSKNRLGGIQVMTLSGYTPQAVSNADIETLFSGYQGVENATGFSFRYAGHSFYQINFPSENVSWRYDGRTGCWDKVQSGQGRHRAELMVNHQNKTFVTDYEDGKTYLFDPLSLTDNGEMIIREFIGRHLMSGNISHFAEIWLDMESGVGTPTGQGQNPQLMMQISKDGGRTWGNERWADIGRQGRYGTQAKFRRLGATGGAGEWLFKFRVTDPVKVVFLSAWGRSGA